MHVTFYRFNDNYMRAIVAATTEKKKIIYIYIYKLGDSIIICNLIMRGLAPIAYAREEKGQGHEC
jgi:hypothetical protein